MKINVEMEVNYWTRFSDFLSVVGWVEDYEILVIIPLDDPRAQELTQNAGEKERKQ